MQWVLENLQLILVVAGAIAWWLNQRARENSGEEADYDGDGVPDSRRRPSSDVEADEDADERVRRIQEEIRRKIAERRAANGPTPAPEEPAPAWGQPEFSPPPLVRVEPPPLPVSSRPEPTPADAFAQKAAASLERQRKLQEQLDALAEKRRQAERAVAQAVASVAGGVAVGVYGSNSSSAAQPMPLSGLRAELRDPQALRRAVVLREVLGPPVCLR